MDIHRANIGKHQKECWKFKTNWQNNSSVAKSTFPNMWHPADNCRKLIKKNLLTYVFGNLFHFSVFSVMIENCHQAEFDDNNSCILYSNLKKIQSQFIIKYSDDLIFLETGFERIFLFFQKSKLLGGFQKKVRSPNLSEIIYSSHQNHVIVK